MDRPHGDAAISRHRDLLASLLATGQARGAVRADIPADLLAALCDGWMMMFPIEPDRFTPDRVQALLDAALTLIAPSPGASGTSSG
ncbi:TetR family transcriptional regulator C-terminal domain-containing protein [Streptomyces aureocirculatus]|uniref:TetR family transcriptional regulator C-terminal domain-containing protein n=1 Tax=Streptomyces aureocirculatus TaxID=67275 RepID=UPI0004C48CD6|nr:TetR family transcriptional regulator C-terminal domain-containing protein [Streptomyces aureocirculatus]